MRAARSAPGRSSATEIAKLWGQPMIVENRPGANQLVGIGQLKTGLLERVKDPVALAMMRSIKSALDPNGILNPGTSL